MLLPSIAFNLLAIHNIHDVVARLPKSEQITRTRLVANYGTCESDVEEYYQFSSFLQYAIYP